MTAKKIEPENVQQQFRLLESHASRYPLPEIDRLIKEGGTTDALRILVSTLLSARTKDIYTRKATEGLFSLASDLHGLSCLPEADILGAIKPVGFPHQKSSQLSLLFRTLIEHHDSRVPEDLESLLTLPGVGPKTAALVQAAAFGIPSICVDIHVLRISGRTGWISPSPWTSQNMQKAQTELEALFPRDQWNRLNPVLVAHGQHCCKPQKPDCLSCILGPGNCDAACSCQGASGIDHPE